MFFFRMAAQRQSKVVETVQERPSLAFAFAAGSLFTVYYLWVVVKVSMPICQDCWFLRIKPQCNMTCIINFMVNSSGQYFNKLVIHQWFALLWLWTGFCDCECDSHCCGYGDPKFKVLVLAVTVTQLPSCLPCGHCACCIFQFHLGLETLLQRRNMATMHKICVVVQHKQAPLHTLYDGLCRNLASCAGTGGCRGWSNVTVRWPRTTTGPHGGASSHTCRPCWVPLFRPGRRSTTAGGLPGRLCSFRI